ncbi:GNAT family protein [Brachybacterium sp. GPGPB12]|uniref:GNAT family N-acetyltransferase n=1 Tax=Brachybacterium sp. GPGPB12 TaxID=3023517 RepID=UPI00313433F6
MAARHDGALAGVDQRCVRRDIAPVARDYSGAMSEQTRAEPFPALSALYPSLGLVVRAGDLTLRPLADEDLPEYAALIRRPIFEDPASPQVFPWYRAAPETRVREAPLRFQWTPRGGISPERWTLAFGVWAGGRLIGAQDVSAERFGERRTVTSGSWLTLDAHGNGYGRLMRQAMLVLAFDHLGARGPSPPPWSATPLLRRLPRLRLHRQRHRDLHDPWLARGAAALPRHARERCVGPTCRWRSKGSRPRRGRCSAPDQAAGSARSGAGDVPAGTARGRREAVGPAPAQQ